MMKHFLAINHESYDTSTVFGVFDTFEAARDHLEAEAAKPNSYSSANIADVEEWDASQHKATFERDYRNPMLWVERWRTQQEDRT